MALIAAYRKDGALLEDIQNASGDENTAHAWWLGQSGFLIKWGTRHLLLDPYLSDSLTDKYANTDKPHVRMSEQVVKPEALDFIDVVTSSHNHTDHLDADTLIPLIRSNPDITMIIPEANRAFVCDRIKMPTDFPVGLNDGESVEVNDFTFFGIPAAHNSIDRDELGNCRYMGWVIRFGDKVIYHSGDTLWHDDIADALRSFNIDLAFLPINGNKPERRVAGNLDHREAVALGRELDIDMVVPCHYDMFTFNTADVQDFVRAARSAGQPFKVLLGGEGFSF